MPPRQVEALAVVLPEAVLAAAIQAADRMEALPVADTVTTN
jgi:hypothetical protein